MTASMCFSSTTTVRPTVAKMRWAMAMSIGLAEFAGAEGGDAGGDHGGGVGHGTDDGEIAVRPCLLDGGGGDGGGEGQDQSFAG